VRGRLAFFVTVIQLILFAGHASLYETIVYFWPLQSDSAVLYLRIALAVLSVTFVTASLLAFRYFNLGARIYYTLAAAWLGTFSFLFFASCALWLAYGAALLVGLPPNREEWAILFLAAALLVSVYGIINAAVIRVKRVTVKLQNLPEAWRGRSATLVSDVHLGHVRNLGSMRRLVAKVGVLKSDIVFITGDLYDGTAADYNGLAAPWSTLDVPLGKYFVLGNHEAFSDSTRYLNAVAGAGIRILNRDQVEIDGVQLIGVRYHDATHAEHFRAVLQEIGVERDRPSILLTHAPDHVPVSAAEGISLQLSGHTHGGQFFPFNLFVKRMYGAFAYGLSRLGSLQVYTTYGAGTWGPPMRVGTNAEIVLIRFE
jgi:predicted MPP superfamily phosphohydrolase